MEIAGVGVEKSDLLLHSPHDARVAVADERDVVVDVKKGAAGVVEKELFPSANNFEWVLIRNTEIFSKEFAA